MENGRGERVREREREVKLAIHLQMIAPWRLDAISILKQLVKFVETVFLQMTVIHLQL